VSDLVRDFYPLANSAI